MQHSFILRNANIDFEYWVYSKCGRDIYFWISNLSDGVKTIYKNHYFARNDNLTQKENRKND